VQKELLHRNDKKMSLLVERVTTTPSSSSIDAVIVAVFVAMIKIVLKLKLKFILCVRINTDF